MADVKRPPTPKFTTPIGVARYPKLIEADDYQGSLKFKTGLILTSEDAEVVKAKISEIMPEAHALMKAAEASAKSKGKKLKPQDEMEAFSDMMDPDTGEPTGNVLFNFSSNAVYVDKKTGKEIKRVIPFFTAKGESVPFKDRPNIWGGSRIRVSYSMFPYHNAGANNYGVSLRLEAIKVIEAVLGGSGGSAEGYGFSEEEEGWSKPAAGGMDGDESGDESSSDAGAVQDAGDGDF